MNTFSPSEEPIVPPHSSPTPPDEPKSLLDWENLIGGKWALWTGSLCLFLAFASFLAYTWRFIPPPPPWAKVAMGLGMGAMLLGAGEWFRSSTQKWFTEGLSGAGLALCYLSLWAAAGFFNPPLLPHSVAFGGMAFLTALGVALAVRAKAPALSILSTIGGFLTPVLLESSQHGASQGLALLTYVAVLDMGIVAVSLFQRWRGLTWMSFVGTVLLVGGWASKAPIETMRGPLFVFLCLYFVLFLGAACFYSLAHQEETAPEDLLLLFIASSLFAPAGYGVLQPVLGNYQGVFALGLALFWALLADAVRIMAPRNVSLRQCLGGLSLLASTVALPMQWRGPWLAVGWAGEAGVLLWLSGRLKSALFLRAGQVVWALAGWCLLVVEVDPSAPNRLMAWGAFLAVSAGAALLSRRQQGALGADEMGPVYATACLWGSAWVLGRETYGWFEANSSSSHLGVYAWLFIASLEALLALVAFGVGLAMRDQLIRIQALLLAVMGAPLVLMLGMASPLTGSLPFWNARPFAFIVMALILAAIGYLIDIHKSELPAEEKDTLQVWPVLTAAFVLVAASIELYFAVAGQHRLSEAGMTKLSFLLGILWNGTGAALLSFGATAKNRWLRFFAWSAMALGVGAVSLAALTTQSAALPLWNWRVAAFASAIVALWVGTKEAEQDGIDGSNFAFAALFLGFWLVSQESYETCRYFAGALGKDWQRIARMMLSVAWALYGAGMLVGGIARHAQNVRLVALGLLCLTVGKIFLFDLAFLNGPWRAVSLGGMGLTLIFISWLYSRFGAEKQGVD